MRDLLHADVTAQAALRPDAPAIVGADEQLTYGELEEASNRLARLLRAAGCGRGDRVCVMVPKSAAVVTAILGVLKADAIWVPIDPASSPAAIRRILTACESKWILATDTHAGILEELFDDAAFAERHKVGWLSRAKVERGGFEPAFTWTDLDVYSSAPMHCASGPDDTAQILYAAASPTVSKGVVVTHRNVLAFVRWARRYFGTSTEDRVAWHSPLHASLTTLDVFGALGVGAALYPVPPELGLLPHRLAEFIRVAELTQWCSLPSVLSYMASFDAVRYGDFPDVRRVLWSGEPLPTPTLTYWMQRMPHATFTSLYIPTEAAVPGSYFTVPGCPEHEDIEMPLGRAYPGAELLVLDDMLRPLGVGETGDLYIAGAAVSPGYWRDDDNARNPFPPTTVNGLRGDRIYRTGDLGRLGSDGLVYHVARTNVETRQRGYYLTLGDNQARYIA